MSINTLKKYKNEQKNLAIDLRMRGMSYSEIKREVVVPKSTLSFWLKSIKLSSRKLFRLEQKRLEAIKESSRKKVIKTLEQIKKIQTSSANDIGKISKRELWLMGVALYWRERFLNKNDSDMQRGVRFTSSDPHLIKFFLKWLSDIGGLEKDEIAMDIFIGKNKKNKIKEVKDYWAKTTDFPRKYFSHVYLQKIRLKKTKRKTIKQTGNGLLRIRVKASSM